MARVNKSSHEVMEEAMYSKYGLATGRISAGENRDMLWCGIISAGWPTWAIAAKEKGWRVGLVITKENEWSKHIRRLFPDTPVVNYEECENRLATATRIQVWLSDVDPPRRLRVFEGPEVRAVITMRRARGIPSSSQFICALKHGIWLVPLIYRAGTCYALSMKNCMGCLVQLHPKSVLGV